MQRGVWGTPGVVLKTRDGYPPARTMSVRCCAACLHAITHPERPVRFDDRFFHAGHLPPEAAPASAASAGWF